MTIEDVLTNYGFKHTRYEDYDDLVVDFWEVCTGGGELLFTTHENTLYIWSGLGLACYYTHQRIEGNNSCYGYSVKIKTPEQLSNILDGIILGETNEI